MLRRHKEAIPALEKALTLNPTIADAWVVLSNSNFLLGHLEASARAFDQAYYLDIHDVRVGLVMGLSLLKEGKREDGLRCFSDVLGILIR